MVSDADAVFGELDYFDHGPQFTRIGTGVLTIPALYIAAQTRAFTGCFSRQAARRCKTCCASETNDEISAIKSSGRSAQRFGSIAASVLMSLLCRVIENAAWREFCFRLRRYCVCACTGAY